MNQMKLDLQPSKPEYRIRQNICPTCGCKFFKTKNPMQVHCSRKCGTPPRMVVSPSREEIDGGYRRIALTRGQFAVVDADDYDWLIQWKWIAYFSPTTRTFYAIRSGPHNRGNADHKRQRIAMHREIMNAATNKFVDHHDHDTLNNRRYNLRIPATVSESNFNQRRRSDNTSGAKGVWWRKDIQKWQAAIIAHGKRNHLGHFDHIESAKAAYAKAAIELHGEFACFD